MAHCRIAGLCLNWCRPETPVSTAITTHFLMLGAFATQSKRDNFLQLAATVFDHSRDASPRKQATPENTSRPGQARRESRAGPAP
jgi:hypothetical protein